MSEIINFKTDKKVKEEAKKIAKELGLSLSNVMNLYLRDFVRTKKINFSLKTTEDSMLEQLDLAKRSGMSPEFKNIRDAINWLDE
ncbi:MAG TPA: type II toxin-antitoxin system RelB/DinJ family antitoxin [Candidatus Pacearchaeota archaeon]|jgi:addiction module RelB/DinJ family antitoxin|nr:type II toxin-antitoxin system RelB/DinJ family antitoxin [Candidatus Pacearchaeota archaeon]